MPIILYSDFKPGVSDMVDDAMLRQLAGTSCRVAYIPSDSDTKRRYFRKTEDDYRRVGISSLFYFDLGAEYDESAMLSLFQHDAIHLSGGDPVRFMDLIKQRKFAHPLKKYLQTGGTLIGVSAGAMILTPTLGLLPAIDDTPVVKTSLNALGILDFEFYPHFKGDNKTEAKLSAYAKAKNTRLYACDDDAGLLIKDDVVIKLGPVATF